MSDREPLAVRQDGAVVLDGQKNCLLLDAAGRLLVTTGASSGSGPVAAADNMANPTASQVLTYPFVFDGATWDRQAGTSVVGAANVAEQQAAVAEDNTNGVIAGVERPLATQTYAPTLVTDFGTVTKAVVKNGAGNLFAFHVLNKNAAARFFQLHNTAVAPVAGGVPLYSFLVPAGTADAPGLLVLDHAWFCNSGGGFATGIGWAISTTLATFTDAATAANHTVHIHFK